MWSFGRGAGSPKEIRKWATTWHQISEGVERAAASSGKTIYLLEWFGNECKTGDGSRFCKEFGGIGGILQYQLDMRSLDDDDGDNEGGIF